MGISLNISRIIDNKKINRKSNDKHKNNQEELNQKCRLWMASNEFTGGLSRFVVDQHHILEDQRAGLLIFFNICPATT